MRIGVDTDALPAEGRVAKWREIMCETYLPIDCRADHEDFHLVIDGHRAGEHSVTRDTSSGHYAERSHTLIKADKVERIFLGFVLSGRLVVWQAGREATVEPGMIAISDCTRPFWTRSGEASDVIWLGVPKPFVADCVRGVEDMTATSLVPTRPIHRIAFDLLAGLDAADGRDIDATQTDKMLVETSNLLTLATMASVLASTR